jgi:hypothetical protein
VPASRYQNHPEPLATGNAPAFTQAEWLLRAMPGSMASQSRVGVLMFLLVFTVLHPDAAPLPLPPPPVASRRCRRRCRQVASPPPSGRFAAQLAVHALQAGHGDEVQFRAELALHLSAAAV